MKIETISIDKIKPYEKNAKLHPQSQIEQIKKSIEMYGNNDPIAVWGKNNTIVEGHGRYLALKEMGVDEVEIIRLDHLTSKQRREYMLVHNKLTMNTDFDLDILDEELADLDFDGFDFGFAEQAEEEDRDIVEDIPPEPPEIPVSKIGDVYQLGEHRVMCGDSTNCDHVQKLMQGQQADLVVTDPPYNMDYSGAGNTKNRKTKKIMNDKLPRKLFKEFLDKAYANFYSVMKDGASIYVFYKELGEGVFIQSMADSGLDFRQELVWVKNQIVLGGSKYQSMYEPCLFGSKGKVAKWNGKRKQRAVIETIDLMSEDELRDALRELTETQETDVLREKKQLVNDLHPTMKPVRLIARFVQNSSNARDTVLDLFGGSGTTLIACEQLNRQALIMELDPRFVDVIVQRWENFTGQKAVLING